MSITNDNVSRANALIREDGHKKLTSSECWASRWDNSHSNVHDQLDYRKVYARWKNLTDDHKASRIDSRRYMTRYADQGEQFLRYRE